MKNLISSITEIKYLGFQILIGYANARIDDHSPWSDGVLGIMSIHVDECVMRILL